MAENYVFKVGRKVNFRDENFESCLGTIKRIVDVSDALVTLEVERDFDRKVYFVKKINPDLEHVPMVEESYRQHGRL